MPKVTTSKSASAPKPYARSSQTPPSDHHVSPLVEAKSTPTPVKAKQAKAKPTSPSDGPSHRVQLVSLVLAPAKPDWDAISKGMGKKRSQLYDIWRKSLLPNLLANKPWSSGGGNEGKQLRIGVLLAVLEGLKSDWNSLAAYFPGRTKSQISDMWRKSIAPRLKKGETIE